MSDDSRQRFVSCMKMFSGLVKFDLTDDIVIFYLESLKGHDLNAAVKALMKLAQSAKVGRGLPSVHEILEIIAPRLVARLDDADEAAVVAGLIESALVKYGSSGSSQGFKVQEQFIGSLGWSIVGSRWSHICDTTHSKDLPTLKAQWRMEVKGVLSRAKGGFAKTPELPEGMRQIESPKFELPEHIAALLEPETKRDNVEDPW